MIELPAADAFDPVAADEVTSQLLRLWRVTAETLPPRDPSQLPSRAQLVDLCARWMLQLYSELRNARHEAHATRRRQRQLERLLRKMQRGLEPRLRHALHQRLSGWVFSLCLRRRRARVEVEAAGNVPDQYRDATMKLDRRRLRDDLARGTRVPGVRLVHSWRVEIE